MIATVQPYPETYNASYEVLLAIDRIPIGEPFFINLEDVSQVLLLSDKSAEQEVTFRGSEVFWSRNFTNTQNVIRGLACWLQQLSYRIEPYGKGHLYGCEFWDPEAGAYTFRLTHVDLVG